MSEPTWEQFLSDHTELVNDTNVGTYVVHHVADGDAKWIAVSDGVMYAQDMGGSILFGWACQKDVLRHLASALHAYNDHNDVEAAAELDRLTEGILQVMASAYTTTPEPEVEAVTSPRWVSPEDVEDDDEDGESDGDLY